MVEVRFVLQDSNERVAFDKFYKMIEKYRQGPPSVPDATGNTEDPAPAPAPAADPAVTATVTPEGVKYADKRASREPEITTEEVETKFRAWATANKLVGARELLDEFKATRLQDLKKEHYAEFLKRLATPLVTA